MRQSCQAASRLPPHLTRHGRSLVFQIRVPRGLDPDGRLPPIRVVLGAVRILTARRLARLLAGAAESGFTRLRHLPPASDALRHALTDPVQGLTADLRRLAGLTEPDDHADPDLGPAQGAPRGLQGTPGEVQVIPHGLSVGTGSHGLSEGRADLTGKAALDTGIEALLARIAADQTAMRAEVERLRTGNEGRAGPLFSEAAEAYCQRLLEANGAADGEVPYLRHRTAIFLTLIGDKPVTAYTRDDLQTFVNEVAWLAPNVSKMDRDYDVANVLAYIAAGKAADDAPRMARSTLINNYLGKVKTILKSGCESIGTPFALASVRVHVPKHAAPARVRLLPDHAALTRIFEAGLASGNFLAAVLPILGFVTGRRLGLLAFLRREDIRRYHDVWIVTPRPIVFAEGRWSTVPYKTEESLTFFVLHEVLTPIVEFLIEKGPGYVFEELHSGAIQDPADTAQKRMGRLFDTAGVDRQVFKTFHGLRHAKINEDRELHMDARTTRLQVGHELGDVHDGYGGSQLRRSELQTVAHAALPEAIDWGLLRRVDYEALWAHRVSKGRARRG